MPRRKHAQAICALALIISIALSPLPARASTLDDAYSGLSRAISALQSVILSLSSFLANYQATGASAPLAVSSNVSADVRALVSGQADANARSASRSVSSLANNGTFSNPTITGALTVPEICLAGDCRTSWPSGGSGGSGGGSSQWTTNDNGIFYSDGSVGIGTAVLGGTDNLISGDNVITTTNENFTNSSIFTGRYDGANTFSDNSALYASSLYGSSNTLSDSAWIDGGSLYGYNNILSGNVHLGDGSLYGYNNILSGSAGIDGGSLYGSSNTLSDSAWIDGGSLYGYNNILSGSAGIGGGSLYGSNNTLSGVADLIEGSLYGGGNLLTGDNVHGAIYGQENAIFGNSVSQNISGNGNVLAGGDNENIFVAGNNNAIGRMYDFTVDSGGTTITVSGDITPYISNDVYTFDALTGGTDDSLFQSTNSISDISYDPGTGNTTFTISNPLDDRTGGKFLASNLSNVVVFGNNQTVTKSDTYTFGGVMNIDGTSGNVGIGTAAPSHTLDIVGAASFRDGGSAGYPTLKAPTVSVPSGTAITTCDELQAMQDDLAASYYLANDIDCSDTRNWNDGQGFVPVGNWDTGGFTGTFDGQGHTITGLYINEVDTSFVGLFGLTVEGSRILDVGVEDASITVTAQSSNPGLVGILAGVNYGTIIDSHSTGSVNVGGEGEEVGGLVGANDGQDSIYNSYSTADVTGNQLVGGLAGYNQGVIENSYATGAVTSTNTNFSAAGGLVGIEYIGSASITNSYSTGRVTGSGEYVGGLIGMSDAGTVTSSYWDTETSGQTTSAAGTGKTTAEMQAASTFVGWNPAVWNMSGANVLLQNGLVLSSGLGGNYFLGHVGIGISSAGNAALTIRQPAQEETVGGEEITNGDFSDGMTGWEGTDWSVADGAATYSYVGGIPTASDLSQMDVAGEGYSAGDVLTLDGGNGDATIRVDSVDEAGGINGYTVLTAGSGYSSPTFYTLVYDGAGTGASLYVSSVDPLYQTGELTMETAYTVSLAVGGTQGSVTACLGAGEDASCQEFEAGSGDVSFTGIWVSYSDETSEKLIITPSTDFDGSVTNVSVKSSGHSFAPPALSVLNSDGSTGFEVRGSGSDLANIFIGIDAGMSNTTGSANLALGPGALYYNTTGSANLALGDGALYSNTTGSNNLALGQEALPNNTTGSRNLALGPGALYYNTTGSNNLALGDGALSANTTGSNNLALGQEALPNNTTGSNNLALGPGALSDIFGGDYTTGIGGNDSGFGFLLGSQKNISKSVLIGPSSVTNVTSDTDTELTNIAAILGSATESNQVVIGNSGTLETLLYGNVGIGTSTPQAALDVNGSIFLNNSIHLNDEAGNFRAAFWDSGTYTAILGGGNGSGLDPAIAISADNFVGIGLTAPLYSLHVSTKASGVVAGFTSSDGTCTIDPSTVGGILCSSDSRLKKDVSALSSPDSLSKLLELQPVAYRWNGESSSDPTHFGLIAQDVESIFPDLVSTDANGYKSVAYGAFTPIMIDAIKELDLRIDDLASSTGGTTARATVIDGSNPLDTLGYAAGQIVDGVVHFSQVVAEKISATLGVFDRVEVKDAFILHDSATGDTYCVRLTNGDWNKTKGDCNSLQTEEGSGSPSSADSITSPGATTEPAPATDTPPSSAPAASPATETTLPVETPQTADNSQPDPPQSPTAADPLTAADNPSGTPLSSDSADSAPVSGAAIPTSN